MNSVGNGIVLQQPKESPRPQKRTSKNASVSVAKVAAAFLGCVHNELHLSSDKLGSSFDAWCSHQKP